MTPELVLDFKCELAEGPVWDEEKQLLWWVDILGGHLHRYNPDDGSNQTFDIGRHIGAAALQKNGHLILAVADGFADFNPETEALTLLTDPEADRPGNRFNDGKVGPDGSFLAGTMAYAVDEGAGALYQLLPDGTTRTVRGDITISNGLAWNGAEDRMYYTDSVPGHIYRFDYDRQSGDATNPQIALKIDPSLGSPDGMTIDTEDMLWIAHWGDHTIRRWNPETGQILEKIDLPVSQVTSCVFGGPNLDTLYITSAREGLSAEQLEKEPLAGALFKVKTDYQGRPFYRFGSRQG